jgi:beta-lactamase regulating signal transducer with metallopeptidase domain
MISGSWAWSACRWASAVIGFLGSQAILSAILFAAVLPLTRICGRRCRLLAMGLWTLVFIRLLLPADLAAPFSGRMLIESVLKEPAATISAVSAPVHAAGRPARQQTGVHAGAAAEPREGGARPLRAILFFAWLSGLIAAGLVYTGRLRKYERMARDAESCGDVRLLEILEKWQTLFRVRRPVRLAFGPCRISPFTVGILRPVIVLPGCMRDSDREQTIEPVIAHEMAHVRHWDDIWIRLQNLVQIVYFFNPVVWLAGRQVHQLREESRDASVLAKRSMSSKRYGTALLETVRMRLEPSDDLVLLPRFADEKTRLIQRLQHIQRPAFSGRGRMVFSLTVLAVFAMLALPMARLSDAAAVVGIRLDPPVPGGILNLQCGRDWDGNVWYDHRGVDIGRGGKPCTVLAAAAGRVISCGTDEIFGQYREVTVDHGKGWRTRYLHIQCLAVQPGSMVEKGQVLGRTRSCLHFEVLKNGQIEDPELYVTLPKHLNRKVVKV